MRRHNVRRFLAGILVLATSGAALAAATTPAAAEGTSLATTTSVVPKAGTPFVDDGKVMTFHQVGSTVVAGGTFTSVAGSPRRGILAMTGPGYSLSGGFDPVLDGDVLALTAGPIAGSVFAAGSFATVDGAKSKSLALLDVTTGNRISSFKVPFINGVVNSVERTGNHLIIGGTFTKVGGQDRGGLASLNATTGALTTFVTNKVSVNHNWNGSGAKAPVGVTDLVITPDNSKIIAIGNFKKVDGLDRDQVVLLDLTGPSAVVKPDWRTNGYTARCYAWAFDSYVRDVDVSADGSFFAIAATGGGRDGLCDTVARFETGATGTDVKPTWANYTGGDTLFSVAVAGDVVYAGGHGRWSNNPLGNDYAGPGAVPRPGLQAVDARNGIPVSWNAARNPRGEGAYAVYATAEGLWVGSDTDWIGNFQYRRGKLALLPLAGGAALAGEALPTLPGAVYRGAAASPYTSTAFDGTNAVSPIEVGDPGLPMNSIRGSTTIGDRLFYGRSDGTFAHRTLGPAGALGPEVVIDPYNDPVWSNVDTGSGGTYRGTKPNFYAEIPSITSMWYQAGTLYYTTNGPTVYSRSFSPDSGVIHPIKATVSSPLPAISGAFLTGGQLYYVAASDGAMWKVGFSRGSFTGAPERLTGPGVGGVDWRAPLFFLGRVGNTAPVAAASGSCTYLACGFSATGSTDPDGTITAYSWDFGDGTTGSGASPTHTYAAPGSYTATLTVTDSDGATASTTTMVDAVQPPNTAPAAVGAGTCVDLQCTFTAAGSTDPDGQITAYAWDFGDGTAPGTGSKPAHTYAAAGDYSVTLTVTDNRGGTGSATFTVSPNAPAASPVTFVGARSVNKAARVHEAALPDGIAAGDRLLLVATSNTATTASAPAGWAQLHQVSSATMLTTVWQRVVTDADRAGTPVAVTFDVWTKADVKLLAYRGAGEITTAASAVAGSRTAHVAPSVAVPARSWLFSYWAVRGTDIAALTPDPSVTGRSVDIAASSPGVSALAGDSNAAVSVGNSGTRTATTDVAAARDVGLSIVIPSAP